ncbi:hypothetical protein [Kocuria sp. CPCC 205263]|uniref:hypothetical protein n=1 Tax=Kocuria sp. CPCC 205263 TaxID=3073555 RepID=UPI0034D5AC91
MTPEALTPILLAVAGAILATAGLLVIASHRRRAFTVLGVLALLTGVVAISPTTASNTASTAMTATSETITGLADRAGPDPDAREVVAVETPSVP